MNISQEKEHLYKLMHSLLEERRAITEELMVIRSRMKKLDDFQEIGINDIPAIDYVRLKNSLNNIKYELSRDKIKAGHDSYKQSMYNAPPQNTYEEEPEQEPIVEQKELWDDITPKKQEEPKINKHNDSTAKRKPPSFERVMSIVVQLLKDTGRPVDTKEIRAAVQEETNYTFTGNTFSTHLWRIKNADSRVTQPARGYYQYQA